MKLDVIKLDGGKGGSIELADAIFGIEDIRGDILQRVVTWQLAKRRAGTHKIQVRNEVSRTSKKMYKQKGTGGARHGSRRAAQFVGGLTDPGLQRGTVHDVDGLSRRLDAGFGERRDSLRHLVGVAGADGDVRALGRQGFGDGPADAARPSENDRVLADELKVHLGVPLCCWPAH